MLHAEHQKTSKPGINVGFLKHKHRWGRYNFITEEMVFVWEEDVKGQLVWGGEQGQFITIWLSFWSKILASFPLVYWANSEQLSDVFNDRQTLHDLVLYQNLYQNQNRPFQQEAKSYMIGHRKCAYFSWLFQTEKWSETKHFLKKTPSKVQRGQKPVLCFCSHYVKSHALWAK